MHIGHYISGTAHIGLIGWALFGGMFKPAKLDIEVAQVSVISSAEFEAMQAQFVAPQPLDEMPEQTQDVSTDAPPEIDQPKDDPIAPRAKPEPVPVPDTPKAPMPPEPLDIPTPDVAEQPSELTPPALSQEPTPSVARDKPIDANRVAPVPVAPEQPKAEVDDIVREQAVSSPDVSEIKNAEEKATAPEAATTAIITEAVETGEGAPTSSLRPMARPKRPEPDVEKPKVAETKPDPVKEPEAPKAEDDAVMAALQAAMAASAPEAPAVPALTSNEMNGLRLSVQQCWVVDVGSEAANITVTVGMSLDRDGRVEGDSITLLGASEGSQTAVDIAFQSARRAILRCQKDGYELPIDKYDQWRDIEMVFNPESMRTR